MFLLVLIVITSASAGGTGAGMSTVPTTYASEVACRQVGDKATRDLQAQGVRAVYTCVPGAIGR